MPSQLARSALWLPQRLVLDMIHHVEEVAPQGAL